MENQEVKRGAVYVPYSVAMPPLRIQGTDKGEIEVLRWRSELVIDEILRVTWQSWEGMNPAQRAALPMCGTWSLAARLAIEECHQQAAHVNGEDVYYPAILMLGLHTKTIPSEYEGVGVYLALVAGVHLEVCELEARHPKGEWITLLIHEKVVGESAHYRRREPTSELQPHREHHTTKRNS